MRCSATAGTISLVTMIYHEYVVRIIHETSPTFIDASFRLISNTQMFYGGTQAEPEAEAKFLEACCSAVSAAPETAGNETTFFDTYGQSESVAALTGLTVEQASVGPPAYADYRAVRGETLRRKGGTILGPD